MHHSGGTGYGTGPQERVHQAPQRAAGQPDKCPYETYQAQIPDCCAAAAAVQAQAQALLKPSDLQQHRAAAETPEDRKPIALTDERLRRSVSPSEKFRSRTPDLESDPKRRKEEKLGHVSSQRTCTHTQFFLRLCIKLGFRTARGPRFCFLSGYHSNHPFDPPVTRHLRIQGELSSLSRVKFVGEEFSPRASSSKLGSIFEFERSDY